MKYRLAFGLMIAMSSMTGWGLSCSQHAQTNVVFHDGNTYPRNIQGVDLRWGPGLSNKDGRPISGWENRGPLPSFLENVTAFTASSYYSCIGRCRGVGVYQPGQAPQECSGFQESTTTTNSNQTDWAHPVYITTTSVGDASTTVRDACFISCKNNLSSDNWSRAGVFDSDSTISQDQIMQYYKDHMAKPDGVNVL